jgi:hypothetical protein
MCIFGGGGGGETRFLCIALAVLGLSCGSDWLQTQRSACLCLLSAGIKGCAIMPGSEFCLNLSVAASYLCNLHLPCPQALSVLTEDATFPVMASPSGVQGRYLKMTVADVIFLVYVLVVLLL